MKKADAKAIEDARKAVIAACRAHGVPLAVINRAIGGSRIQPKKKPARWAGRKAPTIDQIVAVFLDAMAKHAWPVELADLQSDRVLRAWAGPRAVAMWTIKAILHDDVTLTAIGEFFNRDHSTVITAIGVGAEKAVERSPELARASRDAVAFFRKRD